MISKFAIIGTFGSFSSSRFSSFYSIGTLEVGKQGDRININVDGIWGWLPRNLRSCSGWGSVHPACTHGDKWEMSDRGRTTLSLT